MAKSRATFTFTSTDEQGKEIVIESGVNLGELKNTKHKGKRLYRECIPQLNKAIFRIYGPKTSYSALECAFEDRSFTVKCNIQKPVHGLEGAFDVITPNVTITFAMPVDEEVEAAAE